MTSKASYKNQIIYHLILLSCVKYVTRVFRKFSRFSYIYIYIYIYTHTHTHTHTHTLFADKLWKSRFRDKIKLSGYVNFLRIFNAIRLMRFSNPFGCMCFNIFATWLHITSRFYINFQTPCFFLKWRTCVIYRLMTISKKQFIWDIGWLSTQGTDLNKLFLK